MPPADKAEVARVLRETGVLLRAKGESVFRIRAYERAADRLLQAREPLPILLEEGKLRELPGIGPALESAIRELATTGELRTHTRLRAEVPLPALGLLNVPGLSLQRAVALHEALGVSTEEELEAACVDHRVQEVKGFGPKREAQLLASLRARKEAPPQTLRLHEALMLSRLWTQRLLALPGVARVELAGPARRFSETVDRIALVAQARNPGPLLLTFEKDPTVARVLDHGPTHSRVQLYEKNLEAQLHVTRSPDDFGTIWWRATGSDAHVAEVQKRLPATTAFATEEALYSAAGIPFVPPELREGRGQLDDPSLSSALLTYADVRGIVHSHSTWSDGNASLEEMARAAQALGFRYLTVTEHSPAASYAGGLSVDDLRRQWDEVDSLNSTLRDFRLLKGTESDILEDGALDYPSRVLDALDVVVGSVHKRHKLDTRRMTDRILRAMDDPHLAIVGHLTGRLIQSREPYGLDVDALFEKAAARGIAIEVNGSPFRLDMSADLTRRALDAGVRLVVSTDSHSTRELGNLEYAVGTARRGWARKRDVLNTLDADEFLQSLRTGRH